MTGLDWRDMPRDSFDATARDVQMALLPAPDPCGTGDLFELLAESPAAPGPGANRACLDCGHTVTHEMSGTWRRPFYAPCVTGANHRPAL